MGTVYDFEPCVHVTVTFTDLVFAGLVLLVTITCLVKFMLDLLI